MIGLTILLIIILSVYRLIANKLHFGAPITDRSSHTKFIPTGGGIIVLVSLGIYVVSYYMSLNYNIITMLVCALGLGVVSLIDDIHPLPPLPRLFVQIVAVAISFKQLFYPQVYDIYLLIIFCGVGCINAFNFMDGIAGMLVLTATVVLGTMLYAINLYQPANSEILYDITKYVFAAVVALAVFNIPDRLFAGDVGAITIGFFIAYLLISLILKTGNAALSIFIIVPIFDSGFTTLQRLFAGEDILLPHRKCIYQVLTSAWQLPHLTVSTIYALLQLLINSMFFIVPHSQQWTYYIIVLALLIVSYFAIRQSPRTKQHSS